MRPRRISPEKEALHFISLGKDKDSLQKRFINKEKGFGVFATENIEPGEFLLEYVGRHITGSEGEALFKQYSDANAAFLYFYSFQGTTFCVDGSKHTARLGRFINDDHIKPNSKIKIILDGQNSPHLCAFAITKINPGEEIVYDYGDPNRPWRHETSLSSCSEHSEKRESRWKNSFENLDTRPGVMRIEELVFNTNMKIANGCNAAEIFPGLFHNALVAVKRAAKHISKNELEMAYFLRSENLHAEHLLQPISVLEDTYFAYLVSPLCEYNLMDLIENKDFPERQGLTEHRRLRICQELLLGLQELHSHGILHRDLKPGNILFDINNKLYIADFGASRKLNFAGSFSWSSYEDVGGLKYKYKKESDIQVAGCLVHYILTDGHHPFQTMTPYSDDPVGLCQNVRTGNFTLQCGKSWMNLKQMITKMLSRSSEERPTTEECLQAVTCFTHQSVYNTNNSGNKESKKTSGHQVSLSMESSDEEEEKEKEVEISPYSMEEELSVCEMTTEQQMSLTLDISDEEEEEEAVSSFPYEETTEQQMSLTMDISDEEEEEEEEAVSSSPYEEVRSSCEMATEQQMSSMDISDEEEEEEAEAISSSCRKEELSLCEKILKKEVSLHLEMTDEDENQKAEARENARKEKVGGQPRSIPVKAMDQTDKGIDPYQRSIAVKMSANTAHQRVYDKKNYCLYCERPFVKITRHLKHRHSDKVEVAKALAHRQGSSMRNLLLSKLRNIGNFNHNCTVLSSGKGIIVPKRQAIYPSTATDYLPCKFCFAMYVKTDLWRHLKRCRLRVKEDGPVKRKIQASSSLMLPMNTTISSGLEKILEDMAYDTVAQVVKSDLLIISLGERMYLKNGEVGRHRADIRNKMRELARLVLEARKFDRDVVCLKDLINPGKFNTVLEAVKRMTGFDDLTNRFSAPSTACKLRHSLVKVSYILQGEALRQEDSLLKEKAEQFIKLIELEWTTHVSSNALKTLYQKKWNNPQKLPLSEDIKKLQDHLKCLEQVNKRALTDHPSQKSWSELSQVTLTQLILFNRRHEGEISRMEVKTYLQRSKHVMQDEIVEKKLCEKLIRVEIRGKRGRKVPVLIPRNVKESVELLIQTREEVGISPTNPYIFARPYYRSQENIRGCDSLKRFAENCGAKHPENITSTKLRKHVATVSQLLNLQIQLVRPDQLATFMEHDIEVHREFCRPPEETHQMAKVSRPLFALQGGMGKFKGTSLEDLTLNINSDEESSDSDAENSHPQGIAATSQERDSEEHPEGSAPTSKKAVWKNQKPLTSSQKEKSRMPWSQTEKEIMVHHFRDFLKEMKIPGKLDCLKCLDENQSLRDSGKDWKAVKYFVHNKITTIKRNLLPRY